MKKWKHMEKQWWKTLRSFPKETGVFILWLESFISQNIRHFFRVFFFIFRAHRFLEVAFCWNIRKFRFLKYKDFFLRDFYFRKYKKSFLLIKYKKFLNIRATKFHFPIYKEFLELESYFLKYKTVFRVSVFWNLRKYFF